MERLLEVCSVVPHVNQLEVQPYFQQTELVSFCAARGVHVTAYSSLGTTVENSPLLVDPVVKEVAGRCGRTAAQVKIVLGNKVSHATFAEYLRRAV